MSTAILVDVAFFLKRLRHVYPKLNRNDPELVAKMLYSMCIAGGQVAQCTLGFDRTERAYFGVGRTIVGKAFKQRCKRALCDLTP